MPAANTPKPKLAERIRATMKDLRFGVEIETVGLSQVALARTIQSVVGGTVDIFSLTTVRMEDGRTWKAVPDGSLTGAHYGGSCGEVVSPILTYADLEKLQEIVRAIRRSGGRVDSSTGIHVHVDGQKFKARNLKTLALLVYNRERCIEAALGISGSSRRERYCKPVAKEFVDRLATARNTMRSLNAAWYGMHQRFPSRYDHTRYHGLNFNSLFYRGTIEFRYFNGSLHAGEVKAYVQFCLALAARALCSGVVGKRVERTEMESLKKDFLWTITNQLALEGEEFATARLHLTKRFPNVRPQAVDTEVEHGTP